MRTLQYLRIDQLSRFVLLILFFRYFRQTTNHKYHCDDQQQQSQHQIRLFHGVRFKLDVRFPTACIISRKCLSRIMVSAQNHLAQEHRRNKCTKSVERLCQIQSSGSRRRITENRHIRIGRRFQKTHTCGNDEKNAQISPIGLDNGCRKEKKSAERSQKQTQYNSRLVTETFHIHGYRHRENKIGQPVSRFSKRSFKRIKLTRLHQLPDHGRQKVTADCPQEEKAEYQHQRE